MIINLYSWLPIPFREVYSNTALNIRNLLWHRMRIWLSSRYFSASFCTSFVAFRFRAISQSLETSCQRHHCNRLHFCVSRYSAFARSFATIDIHFSSSRLEWICVENAKRSEVHYRELGHGEYITWRIWSGYVPESVVYNLTPYNLTIVSWFKEATTILTSRLPVCNSNP